MFLYYVFKFTKHEDYSECGVEYFDTEEALTSHLINQILVYGNPDRFYEVTEVEPSELSMLDLDELVDVMLKYGKKVIKKNWGTGILKIVKGENLGTKRDQVWNA